MRADPMAALVGTVREAWDELRIHRTRVLLSLIGVTVAIAALTSVVAFGQILRQATTQSMEASSGRPASLWVTASSDSGAPVDGDEVYESFQQAMERYDISYGSRRVDTTLITQFADGTTSVLATAVDAPYGVMHRVAPAQGRWFTDADELALAPRIIINENYWKRLGSPPLTGNPVTTVIGDSTVTVVVIGVSANVRWEADSGDLSAFVLASSLGRLLPLAAQSQLNPQLELWVPPENSDELQARLQRDIASGLGGGTRVQINRNDYAAYQDVDPFLLFQVVFGAVAMLVLLLGALGLLTISMVTVQQRVREIGIRRSFGATAGRIFFAVMMESVVGTLLAGLLGVVIAAILVRGPWMAGWLMAMTGMPLEQPAFPVEAALWGLGSAVVVGALAGLMPALVAIRIRVIDAIRF